MKKYGILLGLSALRAFASSNKPMVAVLSFDGDNKISKKAEFVMKAPAKSRSVNFLGWKNSLQARSSILGRAGV